MKTIRRFVAVESYRVYEVFDAQSIVVRHVI
jgi:hypothetical protein